jgi:hypothetical protein
MPRAVRLQELALVSQSPQGFAYEKSYQLSAISLQARGNQSHRLNNLTFLLKNPKP